MKKFLEFLGLLLLLVCAIFLAKELNAQAATPKTAPGADSATPPAAKLDLRALVAREFGDTYKIDPDLPAFFGDFDGDHQEDIAIVASGDNPLMGEGLHNYKTLDPYNASFGFGNPKVTMTFNANDATPRYILVIHNWQSPAKKFVLVNIPFKQLRVGHMMKKKRPIDALESIDSAGVQGAIFWDGKKYRWEIIGSELDQ